MNQGIIGKDLYMEAIVNKIGKNVVFTECVIYQIIDGVNSVIAIGNHKKAFIDIKPKM